MNVLDVLQILEHILVSSKKTALHDDVLHIISMHVDPILPLPRARMLQVIHFELIYLLKYIYVKI